VTNKLVVIIKSLKVPKFKKILLYEMKFLVPNYSCLQNPWLGDCRLQIPVISVLCPQLNMLNHSPNKIPVYDTACGVPVKIAPSVGQSAGMHGINWETRQIWHWVLTLRLGRTYRLCSKSDNNKGCLTLKIRHTCIQSLCPTQVARRPMNTDRRENIWKKAEGAKN
jgi:hypothetical protein